MSVTVHRLVLRLAKHLGVYSLDPGACSNLSPLQARGLREGDVSDLLIAVNGALQELWREASKVLRSGRWEGVVHAPLEVEMEVIQGGREIVAFSGYQPWMRGGIIRYDSGGWNEVESATELRYPYKGDSTGVVGAKVYQRVVPMGRGVERLGTVVRFAEVALEWVDGEPESGLGLYEREVGTPKAIEAFFDVESREMALRLYPLPSRAGLLSGEGLFAPVELTLADVGTASDPGVRFSLPAGWAESVLYPLALERLMTHPAFQPREGAAEIRKQAATARSLARAYGRTRSTESLVASFR